MWFERFTQASTCLLKLFMIIIHLIIMWLILQKSNKNHQCGANKVFLIHQRVEKKQKQVTEAHWWARKSRILKSNPAH